MNIYEMLHWIRQFDPDPHKEFTAIADYLNDQHLRGRIEAYDLFHMYKEMMVTIIQMTSYDFGEKENE